MKKHKNKFIAAVVALLILAGAWFMGGSDINEPSLPPTPVLAAETIEEYQEEISNTYEVDELIEDYEEELSDYLPGETDEIIEDFDYYQDDYDEQEPEQYEEEPEEEFETQEPEEAETIDEALDETIDETPEYTPTSEEVIHPDVVDEIQIFGTDHEMAIDPVEPEDMAVTEEYFYVTLAVRVDSILYNMHLLHRDKHELVPASGVIFPATSVRVYDGESVFDVLQREMRQNGIHMSSRWTPVFNSAYVEAINNLFEFDVGPLSGWMYRVNGWFPNFGASRYMLSPGDVVEWLYTVDLGRDLGVYWLDE